MELLKLDKIEKNSYMWGIITSMLTILICLIAMCGSAYAYFTTTLTSGSNTIQAASFDLAVEFPNVDTASGMKVEKKGDDVYELSYNPSGQTETVQESAESDGAYKIFKIALSKEGTASTGFAEVEVIVGEQSKKGFTHQIGANLNDRGEEDPKDSRELVFKVPAGCTVVVKFVPQWGSYVGGAYIDKKAIDIEEIFGVASLIEEHEEEIQQETVPPEETIEEIPEDEAEVLEEETEEPDSEVEEEIPEQPEETVQPEDTEEQEPVEENTSETQTPEETTQPEDTEEESIVEESVEETPIQEEPAAAEISVIDDTTDEEITE